ARRQIKIPKPVDIGDHDQESIATSVEVKMCSNITRVLEHKRHGSYRVAVEVADYMRLKLGDGEETRGSARQVMPISEVNSNTGVWQVWLVSPSDSIQTQRRLEGCYTMVFCGGICGTFATQLLFDKKIP
ncbi:hypothetical protein Tco_0495830, partial [Tanacetum coccineum]